MRTARLAGRVNHILACRRNFHQIDVRLAALYIRKSRFLPKKKKAAIESLNLDLFDQACSEPHALESFDMTVVP